MLMVSFKQILLEVWNTRLGNMCLGVTVSCWSCGWQAHPGRSMDGQYLLFTTGGISEMDSHQSLFRLIAVLSKNA